MSDLLPYAQAFYDLGLCPIPDDPITKRPTLTSWREYQDERMPREALAEIFAGATGIGIVTGRSSGGFEILDIEERSLTLGVFDELCRLAAEDDVLNGTWYDLLNGWFVETRSGGIHIGFRTDGEPLGNLKLARRLHDGETQVLIETRGHGGQAVCPPTQGDGGSWSFGRKGQPEIPTITVAQRDRLYELARSLDQIEPVRSVSVTPPSVPAPSSQPDDHPLDWFRDHGDPLTYLLKDGWTIASQRGDEIQLTRPGKTAREGTSATYHADTGVLNIYSTSVDLAYERAGRRTGAEITLSPGEVFAAVEHQGDIVAAMRDIRLRMMPRPATPQGHGPAVVLPATEAAGRDTDPVGTNLNLPPEFWESKPWLAHILQAADARLVSPDALLMSVIARFAALVPATLRLPGVIGSDATFDWLGCVVSTSSGGKTISNRVAADLVPNIRKDVLMDASPGSGEGLIQAFMGYEKDEKGKNIGDPSYRFGQYKAVHVTVDEGTGLMEQQARKGTTIVQTLCSAWSGAGMGQLNASTETKRFIPPRERRVAATINIQTAFGHTLLGEAMRHIGLPQRVVFAWAHAEPPTEIPEWPGTLDLPRYPIAGIQHVVIADEVAAEIIGHRKLQMSGRVAMDELDGHAQLAQLKLAGMFALMDGSMTVDPESWDLASQMMDTHRAIRQKLLAVKREADQQAIVTQGTRQAMRELATEEYRSTETLKAVARIAERIEAIVAERGEVAASEMRRIIAHRDRPLFDDALDRVLDSGRVVAVDIEGQGQAGRVLRRS